LTLHYRSRCYSYLLAGNNIAFVDIMTATKTMTAKPLRLVDVITKDTKEAVHARERLTISKLKSVIPQAAFNKSLTWSLFYMVFDYAMIFASTGLILSLINSGEYEQMEMWQRFAITFAHWMVSGFFMWSIFVVGHDCGHGTFSNSPWVNDVIGHITHGSILVPYYPWRLSHNRHHMHHNHVDNDYSHPWVTPDKLASGDWPMVTSLENNAWVKPLLPFISWQVYLIGNPDGNHWWPYGKGNRLFEQTPREHVKCLISTTVVLAYLALFTHLFNYSFMDMAHIYLMPVAVFGWWLNCVTYLQHHDHDTVVYDDSNWNFALAAFETVDRRFGFGIDALTHHITDGHVAHHLFFTKIPHYNLPIATKAIQNYLKEQDLTSVYKFKSSRDFAYIFHKYLYDFGYTAIAAPVSPTKLPFQKAAHPLETQKQK